MRRLALIALAAATACGKTGPLRPPAPRGPLPPVDVDARQVGAAIEIAFTMPRPRGTAPSQALGRAEVLRVAYPRGVTAPTDPNAFRVQGELVASVSSEAIGPEQRMVLQDEGLTSLADSGLGWTLRYGVRVKDEKGRSSPLVVAHDLGTVSPVAAPSALHGVPTADGVRLTWDAPAGVADPTFNVYRGPAGARPAERPLNLQPLSATDYLDTSAAVGGRFAYVVRTVAVAGTPYRESVSSEAAVVLAEDRFAPAPPTGLVAVQEGKSVRLLWNPGTERDLDGYKVYRRAAEGEFVALVAAVLLQPSYLDAAVKPGDVLTYRVTACDRAQPANESGPSEEVQIRVVEDPGPPTGAR